MHIECTAGRGGIMAGSSQGIPCVLRGMLTMGIISLYAFVRPAPLTRHQDRTIEGVGR